MNFSPRTTVRNNTEKCKIVSKLVVKNSILNSIPPWRNCTRMSGGSGLNGVKTTYKNRKNRKSGMKKWMRKNKQTLNKLNKRQRLCNLNYRQRSSRQAPGFKIKESLSVVRMHNRNLSRSCIRISVSRRYQHLRDSDECILNVRKQLFNTCQSLIGSTQQ